MYFSAGMLLYSTLYFGEGRGEVITGAYQHFLPIHHLSGYKT